MSRSSDAVTHGSKSGSSLNLNPSGSQNNLPAHPPSPIVRDRRNSVSLIVGWHVVGEILDHHKVVTQDVPILPNALISPPSINKKFKNSKVNFGLSSYLLLCYVYTFR